jgi:enoyl-CoA hydratase
LPLHVEQRGRVALLTLDEPERRNALTSDLVAAIVDAVGAAEANDEVGAIVVTGAPPAFCSGADTKSLDALSQDPAHSGDVQGIYEGFLSIRNCSLPTVAAVNGAAVGAGFNLALCCDVRIAGESARFDSRFARIGLHPGGGHTWMLERAVGPQAAAAMVMFGQSLDGARAADVGLAWRCVPDESLTNEAVDFGAHAAEVPRELARTIKASLREAPWHPDFPTAVAVELERQRASFSAR